MKEVATMESLKEAWNKYEQEIVPKYAPTALKAELGNAFFAGGAAVVVMIISKAEQAGGDPTSMTTLMDTFMKEVTDRFDLDTQFSETQFKA